MLKVFQTIKYIGASKVSHVDSKAVLKCVWSIRKLNLGLTEGEIIQIANLNPESDVEYYLVSVELMWLIGTHSRCLQIIEDCSERLSDDQMSALKEVVAATFSSQ